jgi:hypothetical protein
MATSTSKPTVGDAMEQDNDDSFDILIPTSFATESSVLIQIHPQDASKLDFEGLSGAVGRFEASPDSLLLDFKGFQYQGTLHPGPTCMALCFSGTGLKIDAITNEFVTLQETSDVMQRLDATIVEGTMDDGYIVQEENVNRAGSEPKDTVLNTKKRKSGGKDSTGGATSNKHNKKPKTTLK